MKIRDFISAGFYINLHYRKDRDFFMQTQLKQLGINDIIKRFPAINAFDSTEYIINNKDKMLKATKATALSHRNIVEISKANNYENVLIFEDDAKFYDTDKYTGMSIIEKALDDLSKIPNWEIYFLGSNLHDETLKLVAPNLIKADCCVGTQGYILNKNTFDKILSEPEIIYMDCFLSDNFKEKYITYPLALTQNENDISDIGGHPSMSLTFWENQYNKTIIPFLNE